MKLNRAWNTAVKMIWKLPPPTHTRFLESLSPVPHLETTLMSRYIGCVENLQISNKNLVQLIFACSSDLKSLTGQNLAYLFQKYDKWSLSDLIMEKSKIKKARVYELHTEESWKISLIEEISLLKLNLLEIDFSNDDLEDILNHVSVE